MGWLSDIWEGVKDVGRWIDDEILQPVKNTVVASVKSIKSNPLNAILTIAALAAGQPQLLPYINAGTALAAGADPKDVLKAAAAAYVASYVTSGVVKSDIARTLIGDSKLVENIATGGIRGGLTAALQGKDFGEGVVSGVINQGVAYGMQQLAGYTGAMVKEKFPEFITAAKDLGTFINWTPQGPRALNIYREDDGSKFIYDNDGNILGGVDTAGNSIIGNKGTYVVVSKDNQGFTIYNLAGEAIGGDSVGGQAGALGDLSDFGDKAKIDIMAEQRLIAQYPNAKSYEERELANAKINQLREQMNALDRNDPVQRQQSNDLYNQIQDTWDQSRGIGKYAPDYQAPIEVKDPNQLETSRTLSTDPRTYHARPDGQIEVRNPDGSVNNVISPYIAENVYGVTVKPYVDPNTVLPEPVRPPDSEYIQQDQQEGPVAPEISGPMPQPVPPEVEPISPGIPTGPEAEVRPIAPTAPVAPAPVAPAPPAAPTPTTPDGTAPVAPAPPAAPVAVSGDRELTGGPAWARDYKVIERANGQVDFVDRATGQITGGFNSNYEPELRSQFAYAQPAPVAPAPVAPTVPTAPTAPPSGLLTDLTRPVVEVPIAEPVADTGPTGPTTITPIPPGQTAPVGTPVVVPPAPVVPVDIVMPPTNTPVTELPIAEPVADTGPTGPTTVTPIPPGQTTPVGTPTVIPPAPVQPVNLLPTPITPSVPTQPTAPTTSTPSQPQPLTPTGTRTYTRFDGVTTQLTEVVNKNTGIDPNYRYERDPNGDIYVFRRSDERIDSIIGAADTRRTSQYIDAVPQASLGSGLQPPAAPGTGGQTGITPGTGGETGVVAPVVPTLPAPPQEPTPLPPISLLPPTGAPSIGGGALGTGIVPGTGGQTGITPGTGGETGLVIPAPPPQLQPITTTPTPEQPLGPITPVQPEQPQPGVPVAPSPPTTPTTPPTTPQDPPVPQQNQFPSADQWLAALQRYLTNTAISAATRGIVNGLVSEAQRLVSGGPSPVTPPSGPGTPSIPGAPSTGGTDLSWLGGLLGGSAAAGLTTTAARAAPVTYGQQRVSYEEAPEAPVFESGSAILDRDPTRTFLG